MTKDQFTPRVIDTDHNRIMAELDGWLYRPHGPDETPVGVADEYGELRSRRSHTPCLEYALRLDGNCHAPQHPERSEGDWFYAIPELDFQRAEITDGVAPRHGMTFTMRVPDLDNTPFTVPLPVFAFAYDAETLVVRYDPERAPDLDEVQLAQVLYLSLEFYIDEDDHDNHHDLVRDRAAAYDYALTVAHAIVSGDLAGGFAARLAQHLDEFHTTLPWPEGTVTIPARGGSVLVTVNPPVVA